MSVLTKILPLQASVTISTVTNGTAQNTRGGATLPILPNGAAKNSTESFQVFFEVSALATTAAATLDFSIQGRTPIASGGTSDTWFTLQPLVGSASLAWVQVTTATPAGQVRRFAGPAPAQIRSVMTTAGTGVNATGTYTVNAYAVIDQ